MWRHAVEGRRSWQERRSAHTTSGRCTSRSTFAPMSTYEVLSIERHGFVATVFLDRPEKRNALNMTFFSELTAAMRELSADNEIRAVVLAAKGPHFTVGLDLTALADIGATGSGGAQG